MATVSLIPPPFRLTTVRWLIAIIAVIGFAFDTYENSDAAARRPAGLCWN